MSPLQRFQLRAKTEHSLNMYLTPQALLSSAARAQCISKLKEVPGIFLQKIDNNEEGAVLVPLCVENGEVCLLYTVRSFNLKDHGGEVSFPGGKRDKNETACDTALRETEEEIGISRESVDVWGSMPATQYRRKQILVTPIVGLLTDFDPTLLKPNTNEVDKIFTIPIRLLCKTENHAHCLFDNYMAPVFLAGNHKIWGITAWITHFFLESFLPANVYKVEFHRRKFDMDELIPAKL